ncbi:RNA polymerase sigma factor [Zunongwangia sp.]|uniref:RNA polymerase sigma factor n=1 Tax=Zunongwangia sp. TaxID=1965325 RepID=UPI003AA9E1B7
MKSNQKLIKNLKSGKESAYKDIYFLYYDKLFHLARKFRFNFLTPEDFIQETFLKIHANSDKLKEDVLFEKQLYVICKNIILNHIQREKKVIPLDTSQLKIEENPEDSSLFIERQKEFLNIINQLPTQQQKIFRLHKLENYSYREIAEQTQLSTKTIANHIYLANNFIQKKIKKA